MRSVVEKKSYGSVSVFWLDRDEALRRLRAAARRLLAERPEVRSVHLFGSLADQRAVPGSDADLLIVLDEVGQRWIDRSVDLLPYFAAVGLPVELFCYTPAEVQRISLARTARERGTILASRGESS